MLDALPILIEQSISSEELQKISSNSINSLDDNLITSFLEEVPLFATSKKVINYLYERHERSFIRKFITYLWGIKDISFEQRTSFISDVAKNAEDSSGEFFLSIINRIDHLKKANILANISIAKINNQIDIEDFFRLCHVLERIPFIDLKYLKDYVIPCYRSCSTELLASSGVISLSIIDGGNFDDTNGTDKYQLTDIGYKLLKFGLNENIEFVPQKSIQIPSLSWQDIDDIINK